MMVLAEIYKVPHGVVSRGRDKLNFVAAHHRDTGAELDKHAEAVTQRAKAVLAAHRYTGESRIEHTQGWVDHYVSLVSEDAGYIEYANDDAVAPLRRSIRVI